MSSFSFELYKNLGATGGVRISDLNCITVCSLWPVLAQGLRQGLQFPYHPQLHREPAQASPLPMSMQWARRSESETKLPPTRVLWMWRQSQTTEALNLKRRKHYYQNARSLCSENVWKGQNLKNSSRTPLSGILGLLSFRAAPCHPTQRTQRIGHLGAHNVPKEALA